MVSLFVDSNVFLRFLNNDDPAKDKRAETLFRDALWGKIKLREKSDIAVKVEKILNTPNLHCPETPLLFMALNLYVHANFDFVDAYNAFHMRERGSSGAGERN